jgi:hypothetical protein
MRSSNEIFLLPILAVVYFTALILLKPSLLALTLCGITAVFAVLLLFTALRNLKFANNLNDVVLKLEEGFMSNITAFTDTKAFRVLGLFLKNAVISKSAIKEN